MLGVFQWRTSACNSRGATTWRGQRPNGLFFQSATGVHPICRRSSAAAGMVVRIGVQASLEGIHGADSYLSFQGAGWGSGLLSPRRRLSLPAGPKIDRFCYYRGSCRVRQGYQFYWRRLLRKTNRRSATSRGSTSPQGEPDGDWFCAAYRQVGPIAC